MKRRGNSKKPQPQKEEEFVVYNPQRQFKTMRVSKIEVPQTKLNLKSSPKPGCQNQKTCPKLDKRQYEDPFKSLGQPIYENVEKSFKFYEENYIPLTSKNKNPLQELNSNIKRILVKYLMFGVHELKISKNDDSTNQDMLSQQEIGYVANKVTNIQQTIYEFSYDTKEYKKQCKLIVDNVKDFQNKQLRYKILKSQISAEELAVSTQSTLDPKQRRQANIKKMKYLLAERSIDVKDTSEQDQDYSYDNSSLDEKKQYSHCEEQLNYKQREKEDESYSHN